MRGKLKNASVISFFFKAPHQVTYVLFSLEEEILLMIIILLDYQRLVERANCLDFGLFFPPLATVHAPHTNLALLTVCCYVSFLLT